MQFFAALVIAIPAAFLHVGCGTRQDEQPTVDNPASRQALASHTVPTLPCQFDLTAGDPSVPPELGGPGFTGEGWQTATKIPAMGTLEAPKGGTVTMAISDWPPTLRQAGSGWNVYFNYLVSSMCYESLTNLNPITLELLPGLASHWQVSEDRMSYRFRLNPLARWSDGREVTSEDVVATFRLKSDSALGDPQMLSYSMMEPPRLISKYIVEVRAKRPHWRSLLSFSGTSIFPAHEIGKIDARTYLDAYQFRHTAVTGPYQLRHEDIVKGVSITLTRRPDYWARDLCFAQGLWNFDRVKFLVVKDENLVFEMLKKGDIDLVEAGKPEWWSEAGDNVQRGLIQKRRIFTDSPVGVAGIAINTRRPPLDDLSIRLALNHLLNRRQIIESLYLGQYVPFNSYFQGGIYQSQNNSMIPFDPEKAMALLARAGWVERGKDGVLQKNGRRLEFDLQYSSKEAERFLTIYQEDCLRAGVRLNLQFISGPAKWKNMMDRKYDLCVAGWGGALHPDPEGMFHSRLAEKGDNNNITGFADPRVDDLCEQYYEAFDMDRRMELIQKIDEIAFGQHHYVLTWYQPGARILYWNKFGHPDWYINRIGDPMLYSWWIDPDKERIIQSAKANRSTRLPIGETDVRFWEEYAMQVAGQDVTKPGGLPQ